MSNSNKNKGKTKVYFKKLLQEAKKNDWDVDLVMKVVKHPKCTLETAWELWEFASCDAEIGAYIVQYFPISLVDAITFARQQDWNWEIVAGIIRRPDCNIKKAWSLFKNTGYDSDVYDVMKEVF